MDFAITKYFSRHSNFESITDCGKVCRASVGRVWRPLLPNFANFFAGERGFFFRSFETEEALSI